MSDADRQWPPAPDCPHCDTKSSTEVTHALPRETWRCVCSSCAREFLIDRYGQVIRAADARGG